MEKKGSQYADEWFLTIYGNQKLLRESGNFLYVWSYFRVTTKYFQLANNFDFCNNHSHLKGVKKL